ncbi:MAG TPA: hypothetical protein PLQ35_10120 [bacterium]|nr:hypothetical protein [bacterium]HQL62638.1 hypothetical protein [bacterium]
MKRMSGDDVPGDHSPGDGKMPGEKSSGYYRPVRRTDDNRPPFQRWVKMVGVMVNETDER